MGQETERIARSLDSLPTLPIVALRIGEVVHSKQVTVQQVADILRTDPATSAKLLRLVNSPYFGIPGGVSDVARAIPFVGFNTLYQLVLSISVLDVLDPHGGFDVRALWLHSLTVATAARELANELKVVDPGACFTAGLLHDMGKIALAKLEPDRLAAAHATMKSEGIGMHEAEERHELPSHDRVGSLLAKQWRFPVTLATPIERHHTIYKPEVRNRLTQPLRSITEIVACSDYVSQLCASTFGTADGCEDGDHELAPLLAENGFTGKQLEDLCDRTRRQLEQSKVFLSVLDQSPTVPARASLPVGVSSELVRGNETVKQAPRSASRR